MRGLQSPRWYRALTPKSRHAVRAKIPQAIRARGVSARAVSARPETRAAGNMPRWSQPRSFGLTWSGRESAEGPWPSAGVSVGVSGTDAVMR